MFEDGFQRQLTLRLSLGFQAAEWLSRLRSQNENYIYIESMKTPNVVLFDVALSPRTKRSSVKSFDAWQLVQY